MEEKKRKFHIKIFLFILVSMLVPFVCPRERERESVRRKLEKRSRIVKLKR